MRVVLAEGASTAELTRRRKTMVDKLTVSDDVSMRLNLFKQDVVDRLLGDGAPEFGVFVERIIDRGLDETLKGIIGSDAGVLSESMTRLAHHSPHQFYKFIGETLEAGEAPEKQRAQKQLGFLASPAKE
jgi:hypothetical protein